MSLKQRIDVLSEKIHSTEKPKPGVVRICENEKDIADAEKEFETLPDGTPCAIVFEKDCSIPRPLPKDEKK